MIVAGIGTRNLSRVKVERVDEFSRRLVESIDNGGYLHTGGAEGADLHALQTFVSRGGMRKRHAKLFLPWRNYNNNIIATYEHLADIHVYDPEVDIEARESVDKYHPNPTALSRGGRALQARNYLIIKGADQVIALPEIPYDGGSLNVVGGTYQGIRIAKDFNIETFIL